jgi:hypothetical protein
MARHHIWEPGTEEPSLLAWFEPLIELGRRARGERIHWPVLVEDFELVRRVDRQGSTRVWSYRHRATGGELHVDDAGATYGYLPHPSAAAGGRFVTMPLRRAVYAAGLHRQPEDLWYEFPGERQAVTAGSFDPPAPPSPGRAHRPPRGRPHLVLLPGGAQ